MISSSQSTSVSPKFITFEGGEGCGKSTQIALLSDFLTDNHIDHIVTREPGGSPFAETLRTVLLESSDTLDALTEYLVLSAARRDHLTKVIFPALKANKWVLCDRFFDSSVVYQGFAPKDTHAVSPETLNSIYGFISEHYQPNLGQPDLTFVLDLDPNIGVKRARFVSAQKHQETFSEKLQSRKPADDGTDRFESQSLEFHERVRQGFLQQAKLHSHRCHIIQADKVKEEIASDIQKIIKSLCEL